MTYEELSDDTRFATDEPKLSDRTAIAIRDNLSRVENALSEFDKISAGLSDLAARYPVDLVYDVTTGKGMAEAIAHRAAWRDPRINVEKFRKTAKAPVLALGKDIDTRAAWLTEQLLIGETPVDEQIKAEERRKEEVKQARINAEFGRVAAIQEAIGEITMAPMVAGGKSSGEMAKAADALRALVIDPAIFQEMVQQAEAAKQSALIKFDIMHKAKLHDEAEAAKVAAERAELEQLRKAAAEQKAKDAAADAEADRIQREKAAAAQAEAQAAARAEQARLDAAAAEARKEADRIAADQRAAAQAEHEAKMKAERDAAVEAKRIADEKAAKELAKAKKAAAAEKQLRDAAATMLAALRELRVLVEGEKAHNIIDAAIREATGEVA